MPAPILRAYEATLDVSENERAVVAKINTDAIDRYSSVIDPAGVNLVPYRSNPVVLWMHGSGNDGKPVARTAWVRYMKAERAIIAKAIFLDDDFSDGLFKLYQSKALRAFSVGILPDDNSMGPPTPDEVRKRPELADGVWMYRKSELTEYSAVNVGGNAEALALAVSRGLWFPPDFEVEARDEPPPEPEPGPTVVPELPRLNARRTLAQGVVAGIDSLRRRIPDEVVRANRDRLDLLRGKV